MIFSWQLVGGVALDLGLGALALFAKRGTIGAGRVGLAAGAVGISLTLRAGSALLGRRLFQCLALAYLVVFVVVPVLALATLIAARFRAVTRFVRAIAWGSMLLIPLCIWASFIEPKLLTVERTRVPISAQRDGHDALRIAVLSDIQCLHVGEHERAAVARALEFDPHLILLPGDLTQVGAWRIDEVAAEIRELLAPLHAPLGVYFVLGNVDQHGRVGELFAGTQVQLLDNQVVEMAFGDRRVMLGGVDLQFSSPAAKAALSAFDSPADPGEIRILTAHRPDVAYALDPAARVDLIVCGHTHGGQVVLPFFGPPFVLSAVPRSVGAGGLHQVEGRSLYVSRGIGMERGPAPPMRLMCRPEVSWLTLESAP